MADPIPQIVLDDDTLLRMMRDPNFTKQLPFLATALARSQPRRPGCGGCAKRNRQRQIDYNTVREQIAALPVERKAALKTLLNTKQVVVLYTQTQKRVKHTF